jgi:hypothetical protein
MEYSATARADTNAKITLIAISEEQIYGTDEIEF